MTTRQNTKRKGRGGAVVRDRTYTTLTGTDASSSILTESPTSFLSPSSKTTTASTDKDAAANLNANAIMSSPFSVASSAGGSPTYHPYDFANPVHLFPPFHNSPYPIPSSMQPPNGTNTSYGQQSQIPQYVPHQPQPQVKTFPGQNDLEILERLKETIKNNQHDIFKPIPQPAALASIYTGTLPASAAIPHPEQVPSLHNDYNPSSRDVVSGGNNSNGVSQGRARRESDVRDSSRRPVATAANGTQGPHTTNVPLFSLALRMRTRFPLTHPFSFLFARVLRKLTECWTYWILREGYGC